MELEQVKDKLNEVQYNFFLELEKQLDLPLYFIGSISRNDYLKDKSDLDVEIFTDNIFSTKLKLDHLFNIGNFNTKYIVFEINDTPFSGYKYFFKNKQKDIKFDLSVYKKESQQILLDNRNLELNITFINGIILYIIKVFYYYLHIISKNMYIDFKKIFWKIINPEKSIASILNETEYNDYYNKIHPNVNHLINI